MQSEARAAQIRADEELARRMQNEELNTGRGPSRRSMCPLHVGKHATHFLRRYIFRHTRSRHWHR